jgi:hypothetical protein
VAGLLLSGRSAEVAACALETALRDYRRNGRAPNEETRQLAAALATAVPLVAAALPALLAAAGPEVAAAVKAKARDTAGSAAGARPVPLASSEAARIAGVTSRAVRAACAAGQLAGRKSRVTGAWMITPAALEKWRRARNAA